MEWPLILALALLVPCVLMPAFFIWYLNKGGVVVSIRLVRANPAVASTELPARTGETGDPEAGEYERMLLSELKRHLNEDAPALE